MAQTQHLRLASPEPGYEFFKVELVAASPESFYRLHAPGLCLELSRFQMDGLDLVIQRRPQLSIDYPSGAGAAPAAPIFKGAQR